MNIIPSPEYIGPFYADFVWAVGILVLIGIFALIEKRKKNQHETFFEGKKYYSDN